MRGCGSVVFLVLCALAVACPQEAALPALDAPPTAVESAAPVDPFASVSAPAPTACSVVPRSAWDPDAHLGGTRYTGRWPRHLDRIVVHHSDFAEPPGPAGIRDYHLQVSGFSDIGYHFVIEPDGTIYEGRPLDRMGAHAGATVEAAHGRPHADPDEGAVGIVLDGLFETHVPPPAQLRALLWLVADLRARFPSIGTVLPHRDVIPSWVVPRGLSPLSPRTVCPGDALAHWLVGAQTRGLL